MKHSFFWDLSALFVIVNFAFAIILDNPPPPSDLIQNKIYQRDLPSEFYEKLPEKQHTWGRRDIGTISNATGNKIFDYTIFVDNTPAGFGFNRETAVFTANTTGAIISLEIHFNKSTPVNYPGCWSFDDFHVYPSGTNRNTTNLLTNGGFDTGSYANATVVNGVIANATVINGTIAPWFNTYQNQTLNAKVGTKDEANAFTGPSFSQLTNYTGTAFAYDCPRSDLTDGIGQFIHTVPGQTYNLDFLLGDSTGPPRLRLTFFRVYATDITGPLNLRLTTATDTGTSQTDGITNLSTPALQGTWAGYSAGYQINIYINDTLFYGTATLGSDGTFNYPITQPLSNGTTNFTIRGNFSMYQNYELPMSSSFLVTYLQPPTVTLQLTNNPGNRNASSSTVVLNGVGVPNHLVSIYSNLQPGIVQTTAITDSTGAYTAKLYFRPNGTRIYTAQQVNVGDVAGNPSVINSIPIPVTVYTQPTLSLSLSSNITNNGATPPTVTLSGTGQANLPVFIYEGSTGTLPLTIVTADSFGVYIATLPNQLNGTHNYIALQLGTCCDTLGNFINTTSNLVPATVYTPPALTLKLTSNTTNNNATPPTVLLTGTGSPNLPVSLYEGSTSTPSIFNTTTNGLGVYSVTLSNVSNGTHVYIAQEENACCDGAGSTVTVTSPAQTAIVYIQPTITLRPADNQLNISSSSTVQLTGIGAANALVNIYENFSNTTSLGNATADNTGAYSVTLLNQSPGAHSYIAEQQNTCCTGGGSLITIDSQLVTITIIPPSLTLTLPNNASSGTVNSSTVSLIGSGTPNLPVSVYDNTTGTLISVSNTTANSNGGYSVIFFNQTSGTHTYISEQSVGGTLVKSQPAIVTIPQVILTLTLPNGSSAGTTNSSTVSLVGAGAPNMPVSVYDNTTGTLVSVYNTTTDANGVYTVTVLNQTPGTHTYISEQSVGGTLVKSQPAIVTIPQVILTLTLPNGSSAGTTNSSTVSLIGIGAPNVPVSVYDNTTGVLISVYNITTDANGVYTVTVLNQTPGTHIYISEQSVGGTLVKSQPATVTIPQVILTLTLLNGSSAGTTNSSTVSLIGVGTPSVPVSVYDNTTGVLISVYNTTTNANGVYTVTVLNQISGTHTYVSEQLVGGILIESQPAIVTIPQGVLTLTLPNGSSVGTTNSSTVTLVGTGSPSLAVFIYDNTTGILISAYNTTTDVNGVYTATVLNQTSGTHTYVSEQLVGGTLIKSQPATVTIPQGILTLTLPNGSSAGTTNSSTVTLVGTGSPSLAVFIYDNTTGILISVYSTTTDANGGYSVTFFNQTSGTHTYVSEQPVGGTLVYSLPVIVTIPQPIITLTLPDGTSTGTSNSSTALLIGTGTTNLSVSVYDNSTGILISIYNTTTNSTGGYSATLSKQTPGTHTYVSEQQVGNSLVKSQPAIVVIPVSPLTLTLQNGADTGVLNSTTVSLIGTGTPSLPVTIYDNSTGVLVFVNNTTTDGDGNYNTAAYDQAFGNHTYVSQQQVEGILATSQSVIVTIPPYILTLTLPDGTQVATVNTTNVTLIGTGNPSLPVAIYDNTSGSPVIVSNVSTNSAGTYSVLLQNQTPGTHIYIAQQMVGSTVISSLSVTITIILPTTPTLTLTLGNSSTNASTSTTVYLIGSGTPNFPVPIFDSATGSLVSVGNTTTNSAGIYNVTLLNQAPGSHTYVAQQIISGNVVNSSPLVDIIIQPTLTLSLANGTSNYSTSTTVSLIGTGTAYLSVFVYDNFTGTLISVANTTANTAGGYNVSLLDQTPGTHVYISQQIVNGIIVSSLEVVDTIIQPSLTLSLANGTSNYSTSTTVSLNGVGTANLPVFVFENSTGIPISVFNGTTDGTGQYNAILFNQAPGTHTYVSQQQVAGINVNSQLLNVTIVQPTLTLNLANSTSNTSASTNVPLAGIGIPNLSVAIYDNSTGQLVPVANTTTNGTGFYSTILLNQPPGNHVYVSQQQIGADQISSLPLTVVIPSQETLTLTLLDGTNYGISYDPNITLIGQAPSNGTPVSIFVLGTESIVGNTTVDSSGFFTVSLANQTSGTHSYIAVENDVTSGQITSGAVLVEILTVNLTLTLANTLYTNTSTNVSTSPSVPLKGNGVANQPVFIYSGIPNSNSTPIYNTTTDNLGNYSVVLPNQSNGINIYTSEQILTGAGKQTIIYSNPQTVVISKPTLTLTLPEGSLLGVSNSSDVYLIGAGTPNLLTYVYQNSTNGTLSLVGNATTDATGAYTVELLHQSDGSHTYVAEQIDAAGNPVIVSQQCVVIVSEPTLALTLPDGSTSGVLNSSTVVLKSVGTPNLPIYILTNSTNGTITVATVPANNLGTYTITIPDQQPGTHIYTAEYRDNSGNPIADSGPVTVAVSIPKITLILPNGSTTGVSNSSTVSMTGVGTPNLPVYILTNTTIGTVTSTLTVTDSSGAFNITLFNQPAGTQVYTAEQRDNSGKPIADSSPVTVVIILPNLTLTLLNGSSSGTVSTPNVTLTGKGTPGFPLTIYENSTTGNPVQTLYPASDGTYNVTLFNESSGNHTFIAEQRNDSGNLIADSQPCVVTVLPTQTLILTLPDGSISGTSNTTTVKLIGIGIANTSVEIYEATLFANASTTNGELVANTTTDSAGVYNVTLVNQNPGTGYYVGSQQIPSVGDGSTSLLSQVVTVTVPLPTITLTLPNSAYTGIVNTSTVSLIGDGFAGYPISIFDNSTGTLISVANTTADSLGSYSVTILNQLNGTHIYVANELVPDLDGNPVTIISQPNVIVTVSLPLTPVTPTLTLGLVSGGNVSTTVDVSLTGQGTPYLPVYIYQDSPFTSPLGKVYADATGAYNLTLYNQTEGIHNYESAQQVPDFSGTPQIIASPVISVVVEPIRASTYSPTLSLSTGPSSGTPSISYNSTVFSPTASITDSGASSGILSNSADTSVANTGAPSISLSYSESSASMIVTSSASVSYSANYSAINTGVSSFSPSYSASNATIINTASPTSLYNASNSSEISTSTASVSLSSSENFSGITTSSLSASASYSVPNSSAAETGTPSVSESYSANSSAIATGNPSISISNSATESSGIEVGTPSTSPVNSTNTSVIITGSPSISPSFNTLDSSALIASTPSISPSYSASNSSGLSPTGTTSGSASYSAPNLSSVIITSSPSIFLSYSVPDSSVVATSIPTSTLSNGANSSVIETSIPSVSLSYSATNSSTIMITASPSISQLSSASSSVETSITSAPSVSPSYSASEISEFYTTSKISPSSSYSDASNNQGAGTGSASNIGSNSTIIYSGTVSASQSYSENTSIVITGSPSISTSYSASNYSEISSTVYSSSSMPSVSSSYSMNFSSIFTSTPSASVSYSASSSSAEITTSTTSSLSYTANTSYPVTSIPTTTLSNSVYNSSFEASTSVASTSFYNASFSSDITFSTSITTSYSAANSSTIVITESPSVTSSYITNTSEVFTISTSSTSSSLSTSSLASSSNSYSTDSNGVSPTNATQSLSSITTTGTPSLSTSYSASNVSTESITAAPSGASSYTANSSVIITLESSTSISSGIPSNSLSNSSMAMITSVSSSSLPLIVNSTPSTSSYYSTNGNQVSPTNATQSLSSTTTTGTSGVSQSSAMSDSSLMITESSSISSTFAINSSSIITNSPSALPSGSATDSSIVATGTPSTSSTYTTSNSSVITTMSFSSEIPSESASSSVISTTILSSGITSSSALTSTAANLTSGSSTIVTSYTDFVVTTSTVYSSNSFSSAFNSSFVISTSAPSDSTIYIASNSSIAGSTETFSSFTSGTTSYPSSSSSILATTSAISSPSSSFENTSSNASSVSVYSPTNSALFSTTLNTSTISTTYSVTSSEIPSSSVYSSPTAVISTTETILSTVSSFYIISNPPQILSTSIVSTTPTVIITEAFSSISSAVNTTLFSTPTQSTTASETIYSSISNFSQIIPTSTGSTTSPVIITEPFSSTGTSSATTAVSIVSSSVVTASTIYSINSSVISIYSSETSAFMPSTGVYSSTILSSSSGIAETAYGSSNISSSISSTVALVSTSNINPSSTSRESTATGGQSPTGTGTETETVISSATNTSQAVTTSTAYVSSSSSYFIVTSTYPAISPSGTTIYSTTTSVYVISNSSSTGSPETSIISTSFPVIFSSSSSTELSSSSGPPDNSLTTSSGLPSETTFSNTITMSSVTSSTISSITIKTEGTVTTTSTDTYSSLSTTRTSLVVPSSSTDTSSFESTTYSSIEVPASLALSTLTVSTSPTSTYSTISSLTNISSYVETFSTFSTSNTSPTTVYQSSSDVLSVSTSLTSVSEATISFAYPTASSLISSSSGSLNIPTNTSSTSLNTSPTTSTYTSITFSTSFYSSGSSVTISGSGSSSLHGSATSGNSFISTMYSESASTSNTANATTTGESTSLSLSMASTTRAGSTTSVTSTGESTSLSSGTASTTRAGSTTSVTSTGESTSLSSGTTFTTRPGSTNSATSTGESTFLSSGTTSTTSPGSTSVVINTGEYTFSSLGTASTTRPDSTNTSPVTISSTSTVTESISTSPISSSFLIGNTTTIPGTGSVPALNSYTSASESSLTVTVPVSESTISSSTSEFLSTSSATITRSVYSKPSKDSSHAQTHHPTGTETTTNTSPSPYNNLSKASSKTIGNSNISSSTTTIFVTASGSGIVTSSTESESLTVLSSSTSSPTTTTNSTKATKASSGSFVTTTTGSSAKTLNSVPNTTNSVTHSSAATDKNSMTYTETASSTLSGSSGGSSSQGIASTKSSTSSVVTASTTSTSFAETNTAGSVSYISTLTSATKSYIPCLVYSTTSYVSDYNHVTSTYIAYTTTCLVSPTGSELTSSTNTPSTSLAAYSSDSTMITETISIPTVTKVTSATTTSTGSLTTSTVHSITTYTSDSMIVTETVVDYTTVCTLTSLNEYSVSRTITTESESAITTPNTLSTVSVTELSQTTRSSHSLTTSTIYTTTIYTITSCAPTITNCPDHIGSVTTEVISLTTTICPITERVSASTVEPTEPYATTLTVYATTVETITSCAPEVTDCPAKIGSLTTTSYAVYTAITTVTPTLPGSTPEPYLATQAPPPTVSLYTEGPAPTESAEPYSILPAPSVTQFTEPAWSAPPSYNQTWSSNITMYSEPIVEYVHLSSVAEVVSTSAVSEITSPTVSSKPTKTSPTVSKYTAGAAQNAGRVSVVILVCIVAFFL